MLHESKTGPFQYRQVGSRRLRLTKSLEVCVIGQTIVIPEGFEWDGVTIPGGKSCEWLFGHKLSPDTLVASCVHDWFCDLASSYNSWAVRLCADSLFLACLIANRVRVAKVVAFFFAVVVYGMVKFLGCKLWRKVLWNKFYNLPPLLDFDRANEHEQAERSV